LIKNAEKGGIFGSISGSFGGNFYIKPDETVMNQIQELQAKERQKRLQDLLDMGFDKASAEKVSITLL